MMTAGQIKACDDFLKDTGAKCHSESLAFKTCFSAKMVCGSDNKTVVQETNDQCKSEIDAYVACLKT